ncbi:GNAT family N-acetyltransferase [Ornithinimicrobium cryptoxanthini]|uniref:GNAT family N-acetyltransferase n=1 Tax=Ornithinimicrobium cryptoxanthini TaxID=2934161 RepID=A0ABY4YMU2_9MICO|nr:GNAT family N-acetyltransferase [Ornithinimicrobium cryptoxanthini]USQ77914.1 GNAT family N-acetyltransferase [Ornithinimicrobium cryptoxanthini]
MTTWGHLRTEDVPAWAELTNLLARVDETEEFYEPEDLAEELTEHGFTSELDSWTLWQAEQLVGYGQLRLRQDHQGDVVAHLGGGIHPDHRGRGLGRALMDRMEARAVELGDQRHPGARQLWGASGNLEGASVRPMLEHRGYRPVRWWNEMKQLLPATVDVPEVDALLVSPTDEHQEATRLAHNEAFRDHWGSGPTTPERWADSWTARSNRPALSTLALDADGSVLAYVMVGQWVAGEAYVNLVGTVPAARGRGLAHAALLRTIGRAEGYESISLDVDSHSPTGATRLYEKAGFVLSKTTASYQREALRR